MARTPRYKRKNVYLRPTRIKLLEYLESKAKYYNGKGYVHGIEQWEIGFATDMVKDNVGRHLRGMAKLGVLEIIYLAGGKPNNYYVLIPSKKIKEGMAEDDAEMKRLTNERAVRKASGKNRGLLSSDDDHCVVSGQREAPRRAAFAPNGYGPMSRQYAVTPDAVPMMLDHAKEKPAEEQPEEPVEEQLPAEKDIKRSVRALTCRGFRDISSKAKARIAEVIEECGRDKTAEGLRWALSLSEDDPRRCLEEGLNKATLLEYGGKKAVSADEDEKTQQLADSLELERAFFL